MWAMTIIWIGFILVCLFVRGCAVVNRSERERERERDCIYNDDDVYYVERDKT